MKINKIAIENFKFHHNLEFDIKTKNCLIYGENGTGKSSIYEALYAVFYYFKDTKIANSQISIRDTFLHRDYMSNDLKVDIMFDDHRALNRIDDTLNNEAILKDDFSGFPQGQGILSGSVGDACIYFANEKILSNIVEGNFFDVLNNNLSIHFPKLETFKNIYESVKTELHQLSHDTELSETNIIQDRTSADKTCEFKLNHFIPIENINSVLKKLNCDFEIEFTFKNSDIDNDTHQFSNPIISIRIKDIDDRDDFKNHFNEAKLKLISIAIYFALAKKYETANSLKLLVLDDFLTSLDMANRKIIARYILDNFQEYQMIILTHNLQFNNLIKRLLRSDQWDTKILFNIFEDNKIKSLIKDKNDNYIDEAKKFIETPNYDLHLAGNLLRKAFEGIINEFEQLLELGKVETMQKIINALKDTDKYFYNKPHEVLEKLINDFERMFENQQQPNAAKINQIKTKINQIKNNKITFIKEDEDNIKYNIIKKAEFYKNILLNPSSHHDSENEIYKDECKNTIILLEELNSILATLKR
jgi:ABC-type dipeptide/oligopeptide/nickel transport system ATPase subunit